MPTILITDDNERTRRMLVRRLTKLDFTVITAEDGTKALEILKAKNVDIVLLDQMMPDITGIETFEEIKKQFPSPPPVVMMTAHATLHLAVQFLKAGGDDFVQKPLDFDILESKIQRAIENKKRLEHETAERLRAEKALVKERNLLRTIMDTVVDFIYAKDAKGRYLITNLAQARSLGKESIDEVVGKTTAELYPPDVAARYDADDKHIIKTGQAMLNKETMHLDKNDNPLWLLTTKVPLRNAKGKIVGVVGYSHNITAQKTIETALLELQKLRDNKYVPDDSNQTHSDVS